MGRERNRVRLRRNLSPLLRTSAFSVAYLLSGATVVTALRNIDFSMDRGEVVGVVGPSGSGKSTLALALLGALPRNARVSGSIEFTGVTMSPVFQEPLLALHPMLTVRRQIHEALRAKRRWNKQQMRAEVENALHLAGLDPDRFGKAYPHHLSGGQRHRGLIAQAIAGQPDLIIADEPTASLDADSALAIIALLKSLQKQLHTAFLFITHSESLLPGFADRVLTMREGCLIG